MRDFELAHIDTHTQTHLTVATSQTHLTVAPHSRTSQTRIIDAHRSTRAHTQSVRTCALPDAHTDARAWASERMTGGMRARASSLDYSYDNAPAHAHTTALEQASVRTRVRAGTEKHAVVRFQSAP